MRFYSEEKKWDHHSESQTLQAEHQVLLPAQIAIQEQGKVLQDRIEVYRQSLADRKKREADEAYDQIMKESEIKRRERQLDLQETRQVEQELKLIRQKFEKSTTPTRASSSSFKPSRPLVNTSNNTNSNTGGGGPVWANPDFLKNKSTTKQEEQRDRYRQQQEHVQKTYRIHRQRSTEKVKQLRQWELEENRLRAERKAKNRMKHVRFQLEEEWDAQTAQRLQEEKEKAQLESQAKQGTCPQTAMNEVRATTKAEKHAQWASMSAERRKHEKTMAHHINQQAQQEEEESFRAIEQAKAQERAELERLMQEQKKQEANLALAEAKLREQAKQQACEEKEKAKALDVKKSHKGKEQPSDDTEATEEEDDHEEDDHEWEEAEKARFLAEAKLELEKRNKHLEKQKQKEQEARQKTQLMLEREAARNSVLQEYQLQELAIAEDTATPEEILRLEAEGADGDEDLEQVLKDLVSYRECIGELEHKLHKVHSREAKKLQRIEEKMIQYQYEIRQEAIAEIHHYTDEELADKERQARETKEIVETLRRSNNKIRKERQEMKEKMRALYAQNHRLEESIQETNAYIAKLTNVDKDLLAKEHYWEDVVTKYKQAIKQHEDALAYRSQVAECEHNLKELYVRAELKIVSRFQNDSDDDALVMKLGAMILGESG